LKRQKKTAQTVRIELNKYTRTILEKYEDAHMPGELALPVMSNQKMNDALKPYIAIADKEKKNAMKKFDEI